MMWNTLRLTVLKKTIFFYNFLNNRFCVFEKSLCMHTRLCTTECDHDAIGSNRTPLPNLERTFRIHIFRECEQLRFVRLAIMRIKIGFRYGTRACMNDL